MVSHRFFKRLYIMNFDFEMPKRKIKDQYLLEALNQNWFHGRHVENERLWFTNIYAIIVAGVLAVIGSAGLERFNQFYYLFIFLDIISIFGIIIVYKLNNEFKNHMVAIRNICEKLNIKEFMALPLGGEGPRRYKIISVKYAFLGFYILMILIWTFLIFATLY